MGINVEFNPDLALRAYGTPGRERDECLPEILDVGEPYNFLKKGQRNYWLEGEIPLLETKGNEDLSRPLASIIISEVTHFTRDSEVWTKGEYKVKEVFDLNDPTIHFESYRRINGGSR